MKSPFRLKAVETEKAYFAGFFDGEGYVGLYKTSAKTMALRVIIGQKTREVLDTLKGFYGGSVYLVTNKKRGSSWYCWEVKSSSAQVFLEDINGYAVVKKQQVAVALEYRDLMNGEEGVSFEDALSYHERIKAINSPMGFGRGKLVVNI